MKFRACATAFMTSSLFWTLPANAIDIGAGTAQVVTARDCAVPEPSGCDGMSATLFLQYGGLPGDAMSSAALDVPGYGSAS